MNDEGVCVPNCDPPCVHGSCVAPNVCQCKEGYHHLNISKSICQPHCAKECLNGSCSAPNKCTCWDGFYVDPHDPSRCLVDHDCENGLWVEFKETKACECNEGYQWSEKERRCQPVCENCLGGLCVAPGMCQCNDGSLSEHCDRVTCEFGVFSEGKCNCNDGYAWDGVDTCVLVTENEQEQEGIEGKNMNVDLEDEIISTTTEITTSDENEDEKVITEDFGELQPGIEEKDYIELEDRLETLNDQPVEQARSLNVTAMQMSTSTQFLIIICVSLITVGLIFVSLVVYKRMQKHDYYTSPVTNASPIYAYELEGLK